MAVHRRVLAVKRFVQADIGLYNRRNFEDSGQNGGMGIGGTLAGHKAPNQFFIQAERVAGGQVFGYHNRRAAKGKGRVMPDKDGYKAPGNVGNVRSPGLHIGVFQRGKLIIKPLAHPFHRIGSTGRLLFD